MRSIAVGSVLVGHAGVSFMAGGFVGVDVFFVLSGFLITGLLAREVSRTGRVNLAGFWARRMKRLLPASLTVLVFSALVAYVWLPVTQRGVFGGDVVSAALYVVNWRLADRGVDYLAEDIGQSPVQHYWSLAVEEQFYVVWPILMLVMGLVAARWWKRCAFVVLGVVTVGSFWFSVEQTAASPASAYFVSTTRIWELGLGALLALGASQVVRLPSVLRAVGGWVGIALIGYAVLVFDGSTTWPGVNALVPTVGAVLMIASGLTVTPGSPQGLLSLRPLVWIGGLSYSIYLWHWPMLIAAQAQWPDLRVRWAVVVMVLSVVPAYLCHRFVENPVRFGTFFKPTGRALGLGVALTAVGVGVGWGLSASASVGGLERADSTQGVGAAALLDPANKDITWSELKSVDSMRPLPTDATDDRPGFYDDGSGCQTRRGDSKPKLCRSGDVGADRTVVIVGDSKMAQWQPLMDDLGRRESFEVVQITKSACPLTDAAVAQTNREDCRAWGRAALQEIVALDPDLVIESHRLGVALPDGQTAKDAASAQAMTDGLVRAWRAVTDEGIALVTLLDNPAPTNQPVYECVASNPQRLDRCAYSKATGIERSGAPVQRRALDQVPAARAIDLTEVICPDDDRCAAVIGNVLVYRQSTHLTETYVDTMRPQFADALHRATDGEFGTALKR